MINTNIKPKCIKREKINCPVCNEEVIKEVWNTGRIYFYKDLGLCLIQHNHKENLTK